VQGEGKERPYAITLQKRSFDTQYLSIPIGDPDDVDPYEFDQVDAFKQIVSPRKFWSGAFLRPTSGEVSTTYGVRRYYAGEFAEDYYHRGVDYAADTGTPVVAPAAGRVALIGRADRFVVHGNTVGLDHGQGVLSIFLHLSRIDVQEGQFVEAGQVIGRVGNTGASTGPHLHWGLYVNGKAVDPVPWRYDGIN
jgi:murein DD-endopeptidase MepM/ murein hydrolase activator NlpD